jgi:hypothetical protein
MSVCRFRVLGRLDGAGGAREGTVTIDRTTGIISVRPLRRRKQYQLTLTQVADYVCRVNVLAELREKQKNRKNRRRSR